MVFLDSVLLALVLGVLLGGSPAALGELGIRRLWLAYAAIALQVAAFPSGILPWTTPDGLARGLWLASYALLIAMILQNRHIRGIAIVGAGLACNLVAIVANGGLMPVTENALRGAGLSYDERNNSISLANPHLALLVDRFAVPDWLPLGNVFSIGDVLIGVGIVVVIVIAMKPRYLRRAAQLPETVEPRADGQEAGRFEVALRRSREQVEALGAAALELETALPERIGEAVQEGMRREVLPVARNLGEIKGLLNNAIGRLERLEQELVVERNARFDDLRVLVDLVSSGREGVDGRLERLEQESTTNVVPLHDPGRYRPLGGLTPYDDGISSKETGALRWPATPGP